jgi:hypothetical protein
MFKRASVLLVLLFLYRTAQPSMAQTGKSTLG